MGKDCDPWQFRNFNCACNIGTPAVAKQSTNPMVFPAYADSYGFFHLNSALMPPTHPTGFAAGLKRFMVFDRSGDQTNLIYSSFGSHLPYPYPNSDLPASNETNVFNGNVNEMHEDTEEIDALLYSDSDNDYEEEEASTGHSPFEITTRSFVDEEEDVVSSAVLQQPPPPPAKRRRIEPELDPSLADTASSTHCGGNGNVNGNEDSKQAKWEKIHETVGILRRIIPGSKGEDSTSVLEEAIRYLKSLRLKAKGLGVATAALK